MISGVDTTFLVEVEVVESPRHAPARKFLEDSILGRENTLALAPQVLSEFVHVVTDNRRFARPLGIEEALARAELWWRAKEVKQVFPGPEAADLFLEWMRHFRIGRKRLLDTQLAATYWAAGIKTIVSSNVRDFAVFGFDVVTP